LILSIPSANRAIKLNIVGSESLLYPDMLVKIVSYAKGLIVSNCSQFKREWFEQYGEHVVRGYGRYLIRLDVDVAHGRLIRGTGAVVQHKTTQLVFAWLINYTETYTVGTGWKIC